MDAMTLENREREKICCNTTRLNISDISLPVILDKVSVIAHGFECIAVVVTSEQI